MCIIWIVYSITSLFLFHLVLSHSYDVESVQTSLQSKSRLVHNESHPFSYILTIINLQSKLSQSALVIFFSLLFEEAKNEGVRSYIIVIDQ